MKSKSLILLFLISIFYTSAQEDSINFCNTLKWKTTMLYHIYHIDETLYKDTIENKEININEYNPCYFGVYIKNVSNDTFYAQERLYFFSKWSAYTDTGYIYGIYMQNWTELPWTINPNESFGFVLDPPINVKADFYDIIENKKGITPDKIDHWTFKSYVYWSSTDEYYSDSIINLAKMEVAFKFTEGNKILQYNHLDEFVLYPNPANEYLTIENENMPIEEACFYNLMGQKVKQIPINSSKAIINTQDLKQGMYIVKIQTEQGVLTRKVQIIR